MFEVIKPHIPFLRSYAEALAGNAMVAEDLMREVLLHALARSHQVGPDTDLRSWLFAIMHNQHARRRRIGGNTSLAGRVGGVRESDRDVEAAARRVGQALALLPDAHRRLMTSVASEAENGKLRPAMQPLNLPEPRRVHDKTASSRRCRAEPSRRVPGRRRLAVGPDFRR